MSWIKVETHTPDKPEVFAIADLVGISSDDAFGKCFRVWSWFDAHTTNGKTNGASVSASLINRVAGVNGFAEAMVSVGWLVSGEEGLTVANFERHNGETAKQRGLTAKRVAKHSAKSNDKPNGTGVSDALPREDKRRNKNPLTPNGDEKPDSAKNQNFNSEANEILVYLNTVSGSSFEPVPANINLIVARIKEGATVASIKSVIDRKNKEWANGDMRRYLRPATLFNATKFAQYSGESKGSGSADAMTPEEKTAAFMRKLNGVGA